jgi:hypothetical protein
MAMNMTREIFPNPIDFAMTPALVTINLLVTIATIFFNFKKKVL